MYSSYAFKHKSTTEHDLTGKLDFIVPDCLPSPWTTVIHPEGAKFYVNSLINVVTDSNIGLRDIYDKVVKGISEVQRLVTASLGSLSKESELYIKTDETEENQCKYYLVDHDTQTEFWLQPMSAVDLGLQQACSIPHLSKQLPLWLGI
jgi:hypothetical protein